MNKVRKIVVSVSDKLHAASCCFGIVTIIYFKVMSFYSPEPGAIVPLLYMFFALIGGGPLFIVVSRLMKRKRWLKLSVYIFSWLFFISIFTFYFFIYLEEPV